MPPGLLRSIVWPLPVGWAGNVENGPSLTDLLLGGRPLNFPVRGFPELGQAEDTAGPCLRRDRGFEAETGVVETGVWISSWEAMLSWDVSIVGGGCALCGVVPSLGKALHRNCCPPVGVALFPPPLRTDCVAAAQGSDSSRNLSIPSPPALDGTAEWGCGGNRELLKCSMALVGSAVVGVSVSMCGRLGSGISFSLPSSLSSVFRRPRLGRVSGCRARKARSSSIGTPSRI